MDTSHKGDQMSPETGPMALDIALRSGRTRKNPVARQLMAEKRNLLKTTPVPVAVRVPMKFKVVDTVSQA